MLFLLSVALRIAQLVFGALLWLSTLARLFGVYMCTWHYLTHWKCASPMLVYTVFLFVASILASLVLGATFEASIRLTGMHLASEQGL